MTEFDFINKIKKKVRLKNKGVILGIGDDCALIDAKKELLITVDSAVENVHFKREWDSGWTSGRKLVRANISDIYAKGGIPVYALLSIGIDYNKKGEFVKRYIDGILFELEKNNIQLIGGNVSSSRGNMFFDLILMGEVLKDKFKRRSGANVGDLIAVSGNLGDSAAGLDILLNQRRDKDKYKKLIMAFMLPEVRYFGNQKIWDYVTSSIDISDGLIGDLNHILEESGCGADLQKDRLPVSKELVEYCDRYRLDLYRYVMGGGEDYKILVTLKNNTPTEIIKRSKFSIIGQIEKRRGIRIAGIGCRYNSFKHF